MANLKFSEATPVASPDGTEQFGCASGGTDASLTLQAIADYSRGSADNVLTVGNGGEYSTLAEAITFINANSTPVDVTPAGWTNPQLGATLNSGAINPALSPDLSDGANGSYYRSSSWFMKIGTNPLYNVNSIATRGLALLYSGSTISHAAGEPIGFYEIPHYVVIMLPGRHNMAGAAFGETANVSIVGYGADVTYLESTAAGEKLTLPSEGRVDIRNVTLMKSHNERVVENGTHTALPENSLLFTMHDVVTDHFEATDPDIDDGSEMLRVYCSGFIGRNLRLGSRGHGHTICSDYFQLRDSMVTQQSRTHVDSGNEADLYLQSLPTQRNWTHVVDNVYADDLTVSGNTVAFRWQTSSDKADLVDATGSKPANIVNSRFSYIFLRGISSKLYIANTLIDEALDVDGSGFIVNTNDVRTTGGNITRAALANGATVNRFDSLRGNATHSLITGSNLIIEGNVIQYGAFANQDLVGPNPTFNPAYLSVGQRFTIVNESTNSPGGAKTFTFYWDTDLGGGGSGSLGTRLILPTDTVVLSDGGYAEFMVLQSDASDPATIYCRLVNFETS